MKLSGFCSVYIVCKSNFSTKFISDKIYSIKMNHGPPHKKPRGDHHQFSHRAEYDDFPNLREFLERKDEKLAPNHILLITVSIGNSLLDSFK